MLFNDRVDQSKLRLQLLADGADCARCPLGRNGQPGRPVPTEHLRQGAALVALVGEAPGKREVQNGRPFIGASGKLLDYACQKGGVNRSDFTILNACACGPIPSAAESMKQKAIEACRPRLLTELRRLQPKVVIAVGSFALRSLSRGAAGVASVRGATLNLAADVQLSAYFLSTHHPAHILRGGDGDQDQPGGDSGPAVDLLFYFFMYDLVKSVRLAKGEIAPWVDDLDLFVEHGGQIVHPIYNGDDTLLDWTPAPPNALADAIDRVYADAAAAQRFAVDVETDSKDAMTANLTAIAFATVEGGMSATWNAWKLSPDGLAIAKEMLADPHITTIIHNRIYDAIVLPRHGMPIGGPVDDTLLKHHAAFPGLPHKLQAVATQFFVTRPWKDEFRRTEKDESSLVLYNGRDTVATARADRSLDKLLEAHGTRRVYEADRQQFSVATHMRRVGYWVDRAEQKRQSEIQHARLAYMRDSLVTDFKSIEESWRQALARIFAQTQRKKDPDSYLDRVRLRYAEIAQREKKDTDIGLFKPKGHKDVTALFEVLRIPILEYTKKGNPKTDKKAMEAAAGRHPLMRKIIHLREAKHLLSTYIDGLPILSDGRVHPDWSPKITGRWGAGKAQNWPKFVQGWPPEENADGTYRTRPSGELVTPRENPRRIVAAPTVDEIRALRLGSCHAQVSLRALQGYGRTLVGSDFSQLELRIAGYLARDPFLLGIFRRGEDPHASFARGCFPKKFPPLEAEFKEICARLSRPEIKIKGNLTNPSGEKYVEGIPDGDRKRLAAIAAQWSRLRDLTKRAEYCGIYGGGAEVVYDSIVKDFPEVQLGDLQKLIDDVNKQMAGVVRWRNMQEESARVKREIREQLLGRVRMFPLGNFNPNIVYNFPIQAMAASLLAFAIFRFTALTQPQLLQCDRLYAFGLLDASWVARMRDRGFAEWKAPVDLILNGHDSLLAECDEEDGEKCMQLMEAAMHQELPMPDVGENIVFTGEAAKGRRWNDT
jgi:uracil-DNA glycosylase family 4